MKKHFIKYDICRQLWIALIPVFIAALLCIIDMGGRYVDSNANACWFIVFMIVYSGWAYIGHMLGLFEDLF